MGLCCHFRITTYVEYSELLYDNEVRFESSDMLNLGWKTPRKHTKHNIFIYSMNFILSEIQFFSVHRASIKFVLNFFIFRTMNKYDTNWFIMYVCECKFAVALNVSAISIYDCLCSSLNFTSKMVEQTVGCHLNCSIRQIRIIVNSVSLQHANSHTIMSGI